MKSYIVRKYDLNGRWDPYYNHPKFKEIYNTLTKCPFPLSTLKKESSIIFSGTTPLSGGDAYTSQDGIPFIRSGDFSENNMIDFSDVLYLKEEIHNGKMKSSQLRKGDVLIAIVGATIGKVGIYSYDREANINQAICAVRLKELDPYYTQAFFQTNIGQMLIEHIKRPVARANINLDEIGSLFIPKADLAMQQKVVSVIQIATQKKLQKEQQADSLLQSIDDYLLNELGIQLPETKSQTIQDRMFVVNFSEVNGDRLDPMFYTYQFSEIVEKLHNSNVCKRLGQIVRFSTEVWNQKDYYEKEFPYIEIGAINITDGTIEDVTSVLIEQAPSRARVIVRTGDIIISTTRPDRGAIIKITENENLYIASTGFSVIRDIDSNINPDYLLAILRHKLILMQMRQRSTGGNYPAITQEELSKIIIPILPLSKQPDIVDHISVIRQQAKALQEEGKAILEQAKKEVEQMILG
jgi:restriction endonuclease S subunit